MHLLSATSILIRDSLDPVMHAVLFVFAQQGYISTGIDHDLVSLGWTVSIRVSYVVIARDRSLEPCLVIFVFSQLANIVCIGSLDLFICWLPLAVVLGPGWASNTQLSLPAWM
jgi:hypothetical protein